MPLKGKRDPSTPGGRRSGCRHVNQKVNLIPQGTISKRIGCWDNRGDKPPLVRLDQQCSLGEQHLFFYFQADWCTGKGSDEVMKGRTYS